MTAAPQILALLAARKIDAAIVATEQGPRLARYKLAIDPSVPLGRVTRLGPDLSALLALPVRITASEGVYVEVPRADPEPVPLLPLLAKLAAPLDIALGVDQQGQPVIVNLGELPHLLIAGATGSGKSVALNGCILSLLRNGPDVVRLALCDLKRVELSAYEGLPHLIRPVAKDGMAAWDLLSLLAAEIDRRYRLMESEGQRDWQGGKIVLVVDELGDLVTGYRECLEPLTRIMQLGRAAGVHAILATQRPDSAIVSGVVKAQIPTRLCFAVSTAVDSRVVLGRKGAEDLLGRGDGLLMRQGGKLERIQGALYGPEQLETVKGWQGRDAERFIDPRPKRPAFAIPSCTVPPPPVVPLPVFTPPPFEATRRGRRLIMRVIIAALILVVVLPFVSALLVR